MRKNIITGVSLVALSAGMAQAGGWADSTLGTGFMYGDGSSAEISFGKIDYKIKAESALNYNSGQTSDVDVIKDSSKTSVALKIATSDKLAFGLTSFRSGSIQMQGGAGDFANGTFIPDADATLNTFALMGTYSVNDSFEVLFGLSKEKLSDTSVSTIFGDYEISGASTNRPILGASYSIPDIALRVSATYMPKASMTASSSFTESHETAVPGVGDISFSDGVGYDSVAGEGATTALLEQYEEGATQAAILAATAATTRAQADIDAANTAADALAPLVAGLSGIAGISNDVASDKSKIGLPETVILDFQTGISADTLLFGSITTRNGVVRKSCQIQAAKQQRFQQSLRTQPPIPWVSDAS